MSWQPIETAPKDGTEVLIYFDCATVPIVHIAFYRNEAEWRESGELCGGWDTLEEWLGWWSYTTGSVGQEKLDGFRTPTHWQPFELPQPRGHIPPPVDAPYLAVGTVLQPLPHPSTSSSDSRTSSDASPEGVPPPTG